LDTNDLTLHWMHGLEEYLNYIDHPQCERFCSIKRAIMYGNISFIKELISSEIYRGHMDLTDEFLNIILSHYNNYQELDNRKVLQYVSHCVDSDYIRKISSWSIKWQHQANLNDHFSRGQMKSKCWLVEQLTKIFDDQKLGTIAHYGGWYATVAQHIFQKFEVKNYYNLEVDPGCIDIADDFNYEQIAGWQFKSVQQDVGNITWKDDDSFDVKIENRSNNLVTTNVKPDLIINTSCEHMNEDWFNNIPTGTVVCLQTNDYFENEQHINCCRDLSDAINKYSMSEVYYSGEIDTHLYKRFMIIGKK
tara:strand:- start:167 stop:1081 length:915 start_codon:yes stop_codon:yes gene_type:complete